MKTSFSLSSLLLASTVLCLPFAAAAQDAGEDPDVTADETITVRGAFIPEPQRETSQVASFLNEEDLERTGDFDAAAALTRLSGVSVVGGRYPFVRGLGDRYSVARLNGSPLPSTDPLRRAVPLDLFPSSILSGITVQKTFSANYPGEFGGGVIDLVTLRRPDEAFGSLKFGIGYNTETTLNDGLFVYGSHRDWTGFDGGLRDIPGPLASVISSGTDFGDLSDEEVETIGESLVNSPLSVIQTGELGPDFEFAAEGGTVLNYGDYTIGLIGTFGYKSEWETQESVRQSVENGILGNDIRTLETGLNTLINGLGSVSVGWGENDVAATMLYVHSTLKEAQISTGIDFNAPGNQLVQDESSGWYERELFVAQLTGDHTFGYWDLGDGELSLKWRGAYARSTRDAPYERSLRRSLDDDGVPFYREAGAYRIRFSDLEDHTYSGGFDLAYDVDLFGDRNAVFSAGYEMSQADRTYRTFSYRFAGGNSLPEETRYARPDFLFSPDNIDPNRFVFTELGQSAVTPIENYEATLDVNAFYGQADVELLPFVRATVGLRYEDAEETVFTFNRFGDRSETTKLANDYLLPAVSLTWNFYEDMQLRAAYSQTVTRPQFRELAPSNFFDPETERSYEGNLGLIDSEITNYDLRYEYYLGRNQFITLAGFYKDIENPIEEVQFSQASFVFLTTYINSPKAELFGGEAEYRVNFDTPEFMSHPWLDDLTWLFSVNYTYTSAEVQADEGDLVFSPITGTLESASLFGLDGAKLQGTPEHIVNAQLGFESDTDQLTVLLGWVDERILQRGFGNQLVTTLPDVVEDPGIQLDLVYRRDFNVNGQPFTLGLSGRNLLGEAHEEYQDSGGDLGRTEFNTYDRGTSFSGSLTAKF